MNFNDLPLRTIIPDSEGFGREIKLKVATLFPKPDIFPQLVLSPLLTLITRISPFPLSPPLSIFRSLSLSLSRDELEDGKLF